jgi:hypothetical protein
LEGLLDEYLNDLQQGLQIETRLSSQKKGKGSKFQSQYCFFLVQEHTFLTLGGRGKT